MADRLSLEELKKKRQEGAQNSTERKVNVRSNTTQKNEADGERKSIEQLREERMNRGAAPSTTAFNNMMARHQQEKPAGFDYALEKARNTVNTTTKAMSRNGSALQGALDIAKRERENKKKLEGYEPVYDSSNEDKTMASRSREKNTPVGYKNKETGETMTVEEYRNAKATVSTKENRGAAVSSFKGAKKRAIEEALQQQADTSWMPEKEPETAKEYADYIDKYYQSLSDPELASLSDEELSAKITSAKDEKEGNKDKLKNYEPIYGSFDSPVLARNITKDTKLAGYRNRLTGETMSAEEHDALEGNTAIDKYENEQSVRKNQKAIKKWSEDYAKLTPEQEQAVMQMYITDHDEEEATEQEQAIRDTIGSRDPFELEKAYNSAKENLESQGINADDMEEYYSWIHNRQIDTKKRRELEEETKQEGLKGFLINAKESATSVGDSLLSGADFVDQLGHSAKNYFGGDEAYTPYDPYSARFTQSRNRKREAVSNDIDSTIGKFVYDVGMSMADSAAAMATGSEPVSLGIMAASAGSQAYVDASERGVDTNKAAAIGIANAAAEAGFEKLSLDHLYGMAENPTKTTFKKKILDWAAQSGIEGSEEVFTDFADEAADRMINGGLSEYSTNVKEYMKNGMSEDEAKTAANKQFWNQVGQDFVAGAISGAVFGGVANTVNTVQYHKMGKTINQDNTMRDTILETAEQMPENSTAKQIADTVKADNITDSQMSQIIESMANSEDVNLDKVITEGFVRKGAEQEQAQQQAQKLINDTVDTSNTEEENATNKVADRMVNAEGITAENQKVAPVQQYSRNQTGVTEAVNKNTGKQNIVVEIAESTPEKTMVKLSDGSIVDYKTVEINNPTMRNLYNFAATFDDTKAANAVIENYNGESMPTYLESAAVFYNAGKLGKTSYESIMNNPINARIVSEMSPSTLLEMYYLGENSRSPLSQNSNVQQAVKMGTGSVIDNRLDKSDNRMKSVVEMVAKKTGLDIELNDELEHGENGNFQKALSRIALAKTTGQGNTTNEYTTLVHELGEFSEAYNHEGMQKVVDTVLDYVTTKEGAAYLTNTIEQYHKAYKTVEKGKTYEDSANEYVFDYVAGLFADKDGVEAFSKYMSENMTESAHKSILKTIADFFKGVYDKITSYLNDHVLSSTAKKALRADAEEAQRIRDMFLGELKKAQENYKRENVTAEKGETETIDISSKKTVSKDDKKNPFKTYSLNIEERLSGDELLNALDMIEEIKRAGGEVDEYGNVRLYHATSEKAAKKIREEKIMVAKEDGIFFSTKKDGQIVGYGKEILEFTIPVEKLVLDDDFGDELHFRLPLEKSWEYDVSDSLVIDGIQRMKTTESGIRYSITIGPDGIERYALSNETKKLTFKERKKRMLNIMREQYAGRTAKFVKNGHVYYAFYDESGIRKGIYGDKKSSRKGLRAKISIGAEGEYIELAENSIYKRSATEIGKTNRFHRNAKTWDYYIKTIEFEGDYFDVLINVKDTGNEHYVYDVTLKEAVSRSNSQGFNNDNETASENSIAQNQKNTTHFSLDVDSEGRKLSEEQKKYFENSTVRDDNGNLLPMYHGTPNGDFTVFKNDIQFFTPNRWYADFYQEPSASSRKAGKTVTNKKTYEVYLNITNPFDIRNPETKEIFINDYVKGGYALGINPYEEYKDTTNSGLPSWEEADNIYEFLEDNDLLDEYDGIIVDEGGFPGEDGKIVQRGISYVTFNQNQIKNVDNKKPTADPDIRHSVDIDEDLMAILEEEYSDTEKEMGSIIEDGFKALENVSIDDKTMRKIASEVKQEYKSTYNAKELADNLTKVFAYLKDTKNVSYEDMVRIVQEIAMPVIEESTDVDSVEADVYNSFRKTLKGQKIRLNEAQKKEVAHYYDSYDKFRKMNFGNITFSEDGMYLDSLWDELCQSSNYILDMDTAVNDQPIALIDAMNEMKPARHNIFGMNKQQAAYDLALDIYRRFFVEQSTDAANKKVLAETQKLIAKQQEYRKNLNAEYRERFEKLKEQEKTRRDSLKQKYERELDEQRRELSSAMAYRDAKAETEIRKKIKSYEAKLAKVKQQSNDKYMKLKAAQSENRTAKRNIEERRRYRERIRKNAQGIVTAFNQNTDKNHVPDALKKTVADFIDAIDFTTDRTNPNSVDSLKWYNALSKMQLKLSSEREAIAGDYEDIYNALMDGNSGDRKTSSLLDDISDFLNNNEGVRISDMDINGLRYLDRLVSGLKRAITSVNQLYVNERAQNVEELGDNTIEELKTKKDKKVWNNDTLRGKAINKAENMLDANMLDPRSYFYRMGDSALSIYKGLRKGLNTRTEKIAEAQDYMQSQFGKIAEECGLTEKQLKSEMKKWTGRDAEVHEFDFGNKKLRMTTAQMMGLYELKNREQAKEHIKYGGVITTTKAGTKVYRNSEGIRLTEYEVGKICEELTPEQKKVADSMQQFMQNRCSAWGNATTMQMYGYRRFGGQHYYPIKTSGNTVDTKDQTSYWGVKNQGFTKKTMKNARNAIVVDDIFDVFTKHVTDMASYGSYTAALSDAMKWFNYRQKAGLDEHMSEDEVLDILNSKTSVKAQIERAYGKEYQEYFKKLVKDINAEGTGDVQVKFVDELVGNMKAASVAANIRVAIQQPTAYFRAMAVMDSKYLLKALTMKPAVHEVQEKAPIAKWKSWGYFETSIGQSMKEVITDQHTFKEGLQEKSMILAQKADDITWGVLWNAVKQETKALHPDIDVNSKEFTDLCVDRYDELIDQTQVVDSVLHRSQIMRSNNGLNKMATSFMAEPTKSYNMLANALRDWYEMPGKWNAGSKRFFKQTLKAYIITNVVNAAVQSFMDAFRDKKDDDTTYWERWLEDYKDNVIDNLNPVQLIPYMKDILSIAQGYDVNRLDMQGLSKLFAGVRNVQKYATDADYRENHTWLEAAESLMSGISSVTGIPIYNVERDFKAIYNTTTGKYLGGIKRTNSRQYERMLDAYLSEDNAAYKEIEGELKEKGLEKKEITSKVKKEMKDGYLAGDISEKEAKKFLREKAGQSDEEIWCTLEEWNYGETYQRLYDAIDNSINKGADREAIFDYISEAKSKGGKENKDISGVVTREYKKKYLKAKEKGKYADMKNLLISIYMHLGYTNAEANKKIEEWSKKKTK